MSRTQDQSQRAGWRWCLVLVRALAIGAPGPAGRQAAIQATLLGSLALAQNPVSISISQCESGLGASESCAPRVQWVSEPEWASRVSQAHPLLLLFISHPVHLLSNWVSSIAPLRSYTECFTPSGWPAQGWKALRLAPSCARPHLMNMYMKAPQRAYAI